MAYRINRWPLRHGGKGCTPYVDRNNIHLHVHVGMGNERWLLTAELSGKETQILITADVCTVEQGCFTQKKVNDLLNKTNLDRIKTKVYFYLSS